MKFGGNGFKFVSMFYAVVSIIDKEAWLIDEGGYIGVFSKAIGTEDIFFAYGFFN